MFVGINIDCEMIRSLPLPATQGGGDFVLQGNQMTDKYCNGEPITKNSMTKEPWYADWNAAAEVVNAHNSVLLDTPEEMEIAINAVLAFYRDFPGPPGWTAPDHARLERWIKPMLVNMTQALGLHEPHKCFLDDSKYIDAINRAKKLCNN